MVGENFAMTLSLVEKLVLFDKTSPRRVLIVGDGMNDIYIHGKLEDCQDGCKKLVEESRFTVMGGSDNALRALTHWKAMRISVHPRHSGPTKTRLIVDGKCILRHDNDFIDFDQSLVRSRAMEMVYRWNPDVVLLSDYDKGLLTPEFLTKIITTCIENGIKCVVDAKQDPSLYKGAIIKCNMDYLKKHSRTIDRYSPYVVTNGPGRPVVCTSESTSFIDDLSLPLVKCVNHVGAGDCFAAHFSLALAYHFSLKDSASIANAASRVYVQHLHNRPPHPSEIISYLKDHQDSLVTNEMITP